MSAKCTCPFGTSEADDYTRGGYLYCGQCKRIIRALVTVPAPQRRKVSRKAVR